MLKSSKPFTSLATVNAKTEGSCAMLESQRTCTVHAGVVGVLVVIVRVGDETGSSLLWVVQVLPCQLDPTHLAK